MPFTGSDICKIMYVQIHPQTSPQPLLTSDPPASPSSSHPSESSSSVAATPTFSSTSFSPSSVTSPVSSTPSTSF
ncbi:hypothetical protein BN946_scf185002.g32 [Trametes cinnabarina]|uniref:Uncharacterized protein n=1 Tax=Pycnoporus cinnabarinus TaxID=5643 RepID=A0A060SEF0_PYCCI|nr:hypothetical protein BN946_scf185002.g32 [Trametes cinnabarina]